MGWSGCQRTIILVSVRADKTIVYTSKVPSLDSRRTLCILHSGAGQYTSVQFFCLQKSSQLITCGIPSVGFLQKSRTALLWVPNQSEIWRKRSVLFSCLRFPKTSCKGGRKSPKITNYDEPAKITALMYMQDSADWLFQDHNESHQRGWCLAYHNLPPSQLQACFG